MKLDVFSALAASLAAACSVVAACSAGDAASEHVAAVFDPGAPYEQLSPAQPTSAASGRVEVTEVFWYGCPHCNALEPYIAQWLSNKPEYVDFVRLPVTWNATARLHARAFYAAEMLGKLDVLHEALFREIHVNRSALDTEAAVAELFARFGVDAATFWRVFASPDVDSKVERADALYRSYKVDKVPAVVINGRYRTDAPMAGGNDELIEVIDDRVAAEHAKE